ncbi:MAG: hypothetical protein ACHQJ4_07060 [Ignavibacteria bacterium]
MNNIETIENKFVRTYNGHDRSSRSIKTCCDCKEMNKIGVFIKECSEHYSSWEITEGIAGACKKLNNNYLLSLILLNFFFTVPLI